MSTRVADFIRKYIRSVWQLELLLYLKGSGKPLCADELAESLYMAVESISSGLKYFESCGLIQRVSSKSEYFEFNAQDSDLALSVSETANMYSLSRVSVVNLIFSTRVSN